MEVMRTEYVVCDESGSAIEWMNDRAAAISFAASYPYPCRVEEHVEYYRDVRVVWVSHKSMAGDALSGNTQDGAS